MSGLSDKSLRRLADYVDELIEEQEDEEDIAYIDARADEPTIPFEEIVKEFEAEHGPLYQS
jgi:hypothetical protein